jgi:hypothetical protein
MNQATFERLKAHLPLTGDMEKDLQSHVSYYFQVCEATAQAQNETVRAKYDVEQTESAVQEGLRITAESAGEKVTEERIKMRVRQDELYRAAYELYLTAQTTAKLWEALRTAWDARGHTLRDLTALATRGVSPAGIYEYNELRQRAATARTRTPT